MNYHAYSAPIVSTDGPLDPFGPLYPAIPGANKWRKLARKRDLTHAEKCEYGETVLEGIRRLQAQELAREIPSLRANCASGTFHNDGNAILAALRAQFRARGGSRVG